MAAFYNPRTVLTVLFCCLLLLSGFRASCQQAWRSDLYPFSWQRGYERDGKFLHDFSFAGYHYGEKPIPDVQENILDVTLAPFNADNTGSEDATTAIQAAIDSVAKLSHGVVYLPEGTYLVKPGSANALLISHDSTVLRGDGPDKTFILNTATSMRSKTIIEFSPGNNSWYSQSGASISFTEDAVEHDTIIHLTNASHFATGDRIILTTNFTDEFIAEHQMTGKWNTSIEGVAFARTVEAVNAAANTIEVDIPIRYYLKTRDNARAYRIRPQLTECGIERLSIGNLENLKPGLEENDYNSSGTAAYEVHASHAIQFKYAENCWMKHVNTFKPEENTLDIHVLSNALELYQSRLVTVDSCILQKPLYEGGGGNGYMFTLRSNDCLISHSQAIHSRHNYDFKKAYSNGNVIYKCLSKDSKYASDFHMHLSMSNLFDSHTVDGDFLEAVYRPYGTVEHGHSTTQSVFWNTTGEKYHGNSSRIVSSGQWGYGYVIGTQGNATGVSLPTDNNTLPKDHLEGEAAGEWLHPASLYQDQLKRRLHGLSAVDSTAWDAPVIKLISPKKDETISTNEVTIEVEIEAYEEKVEKVIYYEGENQLGEVTEAPYIFTWGNAADGCYTIVVQAISSSGTVSNRESVEVVVGKGCEASYYGYAFELPGRIEAEFFNKGKNNLSYFDTDAMNLGGDYRANEPVDIERCSDTGGGFNIGWIADGEYVRYIIEVNETGNYAIHFRVAGENSGAINFKFINQKATGSIATPATGGWQIWETVSLEGLELQEGVDTLQLSFSGSFNLNYFEVTKMEEALSSTRYEPESHVFPNPVTDYLYIPETNSPVLEYTLYSISGQVLFHESVFNNPKQLHRVDMSRVRKGSYLLKIRKKDGDRKVMILKN